MAMGARGDESCSSKNMSAHGLVRSRTGYLAAVLGVAITTIVGTGLSSASASEGQTAQFPAVVAQFMKLNDLKQEAFSESFPGTVISGTGKVFQVTKCGFVDDSQKWGSDCIKVILDSGTPRVALYYSSDKASEIAEYSKGKRISFSGCVANSIKNWGFWSTATCDMP